MNFAVVLPTRSVGPGFLPFGACVDFLFGSPVTSWSIFEVSLPILSVGPRFSPMLLLTLLPVDPPIIDVAPFLMFPPSTAKRAPLWGSPVCMCFHFMVVSPSSLVELCFPSFPVLTVPSLGKMTSSCLCFVAAIPSSIVGPWHPFSFYATFGL